MLLVAPNGKSYLVDFGGITRSYSAIADRTIAPLFKAEGIREISGGFITHMHIDHYGGAVSMIQNAGCKTLYTSGERTLDMRHTGLIVFLKPNIFPFYGSIREIGSILMTISISSFSILPRRQTK